MAKIKKLIMIIIVLKSYLNQIDNMSSL
ncbi:hypothetical protein GASC598B02_001660, partial [Gilliamella apicola SCGC AB-598-B02]